MGITACRKIKSTTNLCFHSIDNEQTDAIESRFCHGIMDRHSICYNLRRICNCSLSLKIIGCFNFAPASRSVIWTGRYRWVAIGIIPDTR